MAKKIVLAVLGFLVLAVGVVVAVASTKPDTLVVERTQSIRAPAAKIFGILHDFHNWPSWSPYERLDPAMKRTYSGAAAGVGAVYEWSGNKDVGSGRMEIITETEGLEVVIKLDFLEPFEGHNTATFSMVPAGEVTDVTWKMTGPSALITKVMGLFMDMDKMIGDAFAEGLLNLKREAEKS